MLIQPIALILFGVWCFVGIPLMIEFFLHKDRFPNYTTIGKVFAVSMCGPLVWSFYMGVALRYFMVKAKLPHLYERVMVKPEHWKLQEYVPPPPMPKEPSVTLARNIRVVTEKKKGRWGIK